MASVNTYYDMDRYFDLVDGSIVIQGTKFMKELKLLNSKGASLPVDNPLDMHAYHEYGEERLWWIIALYNDIIDPEHPDVSAIRIPHLSSVNSLMNRYYRR